MKGAVTSPGYFGYEDVTMQIFMGVLYTVTRRSATGTAGGSLRAGARRGQGRHVGARLGQHVACAEAGEPAGVGELRLGAEARNRHVGDLVGAVAGGVDIVPVEPHLHRPGAGGEPVPRLPAGVVVVDRVSL